jgi:hypothetical protein
MGARRHEALGAIMGVGVASANSILLVTFAREQQLGGMKAFDAPILAGHPHPAGANDRNCKIPLSVEACPGSTLQCGLPRSRVRAYRGAGGPAGVIDDKSDGGGYRRLHCFRLDAADPYPRRDLSTPAWDSPAGSAEPCLSARGRSPRAGAQFYRAGTGCRAAEAGDLSHPSLGCPACLAAMLARRP